MCTYHCLVETKEIYRKIYSQYNIKFDNIKLTDDKCFDKRKGPFKHFLSYHTLDVSNSQRIMTSSHGNIFRVIGHLCGEFTGHRRQWHGALMFSLICVWINGWVNNREAGNLRRHRVHYDFTVMDFRMLSACTGKNRCVQPNVIV